MTKLNQTPKPTIDSSQTPEFVALQEVESEVFVGEILKTKRQELNLSSAEVSTFLRIKESDVIAIESNEIDRIAKHLYVPGLIRSYGKFLRIDDKIIEEKIKLLSIKSNVENKKHLLLNIGENIELTPSKDSFFNFLLISILLFLVLLSVYHSLENKDKLITNQKLISELEKI